MPYFKHTKRQYNITVTNKGAEGSLLFFEIFFVLDVFVIIERILAFFVENLRLVEKLLIFRDII